MTDHDDTTPEAAPELLTASEVARELDVRRGDVNALARAGLVERRGSLGGVPAFHVEEVRAVLEALLDTADENDAASSETDDQETPADAW